MCLLIWLSLNLAFFYLFFISFFCFLSLHIFTFIWINWINFMIPFYDLGWLISYNSLLYYFRICSIHVLLITDYIQLMLYLFIYCLRLTIIYFHVSSLDLCAILFTCFALTYIINPTLHCHYDFCLNSTLLKRCTTNNSK